MVGSRKSIKRKIKVELILVNRALLEKLQKANDGKVMYKEFTE
jgi:hypothetical protein